MNGTEYQNQSGYISKFQTRDCGGTWLHLDQFTVRTTLAKPNIFVGKNYVQFTLSKLMKLKFSKLSMHDKISKFKNIIFNNIWKIIFNNLRYFKN